jgi:hypothetical protein
MARTNIEWVGGPGLAFETWVFRLGPFARRNPGLKSETWATHLKSGGCFMVTPIGAGLVAYGVVPI